MTSFAVASAVSEPGRPDRANEDGWGAAGAFVWVIDGATGLGHDRLLDAPSDAAWLTTALGGALSAAAAVADAPGSLLAAAAAAVEARFLAERRRAPQEHYEMPTAAVLVVRFGADGVAIAELGDCALLVASEGGVRRFGGTEAGRAAERIGARRLMGPAGRSPDVLAYLRSVRNRANVPGGYAIFAPDATCAARARIHHHPATSGTALLMTDGYEAAIGYGLHTAATLIAAAEAMVGAPLADLRATERGDPNCETFPRFKPSDDATAVVVRFGDAT